MTHHVKKTKKEDNEPKVVNLMEEPKPESNEPIPVTGRVLTEKEAAEWYEGKPGNPINYGSGPTIQADVIEVQEEGKAPRKIGKPQTKVTTNDFYSRLTILDMAIAKHDKDIEKKKKERAELVKDRNKLAKLIADAEALL